MYRSADMLEYRIVIRCMVLMPIGTLALNYTTLEGSSARIRSQIDGMRCREVIDVGPLSNCDSRLHDGSVCSFWRRDCPGAVNSVGGIRDAPDAMGCWRQRRRFYAFVLDDCSAIALRVREPVYLSTTVSCWL